MAIEKADFLIIEKIRQQEISQVNGNSKKNVAILGDCHFHYPDSQQAFQTQLDFEPLETFDVNGNPTHQINLNEPLADNFNNRYDWVIDSGTLYCCFDIPAVFENIIRMTKLGGKVFHTSNLIGFFGRGFYALSPSLFYEFYQCNGFEIEFMGTRTRSGGEQWVEMQSGGTYLETADKDALSFVDHSHSNFVPMVPNDAMLCCLVKKVKEVPFTKPIPKHFVDTQGR